MNEVAAPGTTLGSFELLGLLGRGTFASVYRARDGRSGREVALKVHDAVPGADGEESRRRFVREAELAGKLEHPGIVAVLERGEHEGVPFIAMELVAGETLLQRIERARRPLEAEELRALVTAIAQVARALDHAHGKGVLHRDVKPANILLGRDGRAKLADFGLARDPGASQLTQAGQVMGTPAYLAPEAIEGAPPAPAMDIYALGATLHHALSGRPPFEGETAWRVALRVLNEPPAPLPACPAPLADAVTRAMARDPAARQASAAELADELDRALDGQASDTEPRVEGERRVGRYVVLEELGRGGMGVVVKARDPLLGRVVALKRCHGEPAQLARMRREAELAARLWHPGIAPVHEIAADAQGVPHVVMGFVEGQPLAALLQAGPLEARRAALLVAELADAVAHAHAHGVVHRDLKPANVMVGPAGNAVILDFGLARAAEPSADARLTRAGELIGTPSYMAPEQVEDASRAGIPADVYGLGAILYECLTGRPPFVADSPVKLLVDKLKQEPAPARAANPAVPAPLEAVCTRCLARAPAARFPDAAALRDALRAFLYAPPPASRGAWWPWMVLAGLFLAILLRAGRVERALSGAAVAPWPTEAAPTSSSSTWRSGLDLACTGSLRVRRVLGDPTGKLPDEVGRLAVSLDGRRALAGVRTWWKDAPGNVQLLELPSGRELGAWRAHALGVTGLLFTHEGRALSGGRDGVVRAWDLSELSRPIAELSLAGPVVALERAGDGPAVVAWGRHVGFVAVKERSLELVAEFDLGAEVATVLAREDAAFVIAGGSASLLGIDGSRESLEGDAGGLRPGTPGSEGGLHAAALGSGGRHALILGAEGDLRVWDLEQRTFQALPVPGARSVGGLLDGQAVVSHEGSLGLVDLASGLSGSALRAERWGTLHPLLPLGGDPRRVLYAAHGQVRAHDLRDDRSLLPAPPESMRRIVSLAVADGRVVAGSAEGGVEATAHAFELESGERLGVLATGHEFVRGVGLASRGRRAVLMGSLRGMGMQVWDLERRVRLAEARLPYPGRLFSGVVSPAGDLALTASEEGDVTLWELDPLRARPLGSHGPGAIVAGLAFSDDGTRAFSVAKAAGDRPAELRRWSLAGGEGVRVALPFEPDGLAVIPGSTDVVVGGKAGAERWSLEPGARVRSYSASRTIDRPGGIAATASRVAVAGWDGRVAVFDAGSGRELGAIDLGRVGDRAGAVAFGPDGRLYLGTLRGVIVECTESP